MNNFSSPRQKIYLSLGIAISITIVVALIIWQQYGQPWANTAAQITTTPTPTITLPQNTDPNFNHVGFSGQQDRTALEILQELYPSTITQGDGVNQVVASIEGRPTNLEQKVWVFYINQQPATVGPASYVTQSTDRIDWHLEDF